MADKEWFVRAEELEALRKQLDPDTPEELREAITRLQTKLFNMVCGDIRHSVKVTTPEAMPPKSYCLYEWTGINRWPTSI